MLQCCLDRMRSAFVSAKHLQDFLQEGLRLIESRDRQVNRGRPEARPLCSLALCGTGRQQAFDTLQQTQPDSCSAYHC
jgi:hypothetical protein